MSEYFLKPKFLGAKIKVELDMSNYATKRDFKNATGVNTSSCAKKYLLNKLIYNFKSDLDKPITVDLSKLSDAVKNNVVKKGVYNAKIRNI